LQPRPRRYSLKLVAAFFFVMSALLAQQDVTSYLTTDVARVGSRLACRCGGCKNTVGDCPMLRCDSSDPKRRRIFEMKSQGLADDAIVSTFVREEGVAALSSPQPLHLITWLGTPVAVLLGFWIYTSFIRRNRKPAEVISAEDQAMIDRFRPQFGREFDDSVEGGKEGAKARK
jgi:cytochrome c-type biogenesis protein CcmH/NrfF